MGVGCSILDDGQRVRSNSGSQPDADQQFVQGVSGRFVGGLWQRGVFVGGLEFGSKPQVFGFVEGSVGIGYGDILTAGFSVDHLRDVGQSKILI